MKLKFFYIILAVFCFSAINAQLLLQIKKDCIVSYNYSGGDEFNQADLSSDWSRSPWPRVIMPQELAFSPECINLENGIVKISALKKDSIYVMPGIEIDSNFLRKTGQQLVNGRFLTHFSAGMIHTKKKYHYGLYELRFKVEEGRGIWPAFWFYGGNKNEEIDAFELKGERNNQIHVDTHCPDGCDRNYNGHKIFNKNWGAWLPVTQYLHDGFNIMLLEWRPDEIIWYINGYPLAYFKGAFTNPMNLYLNTSVAKDDGAFKPGPDAGTKWPNDYYCDYIRVWQNDSSTSGKISLKVNNDSRVSDKFESKYLNKPKKKKAFVYKKSKLDIIKGTITLNRVSQTEVIFNLMGTTEKKTTLTVTGLTTKKSVSFGNTGSETLVNIDPADKELEIKLDIKGKNYIQLISLP